VSARIISYVACGGLGKRLWPLSRQDRPKQFHDLAGFGSMLTATLRRAAARRCGGVEVRVIGTARHGELIRASLAEAGMPAATVLLEPFGRETAAVAAVAASDALAHGGDTLVLLMPSDHVLRDAGLKADLPQPDASVRAGRRGVHSKTFSELLDEMCEVYRIEPGAAW
jgi:mannose-1-phosphate guanylyltransferase